MYSKLIKTGTVAMMLIIAGCSSSEGERSIDDQQRSFNWDGTLTLELTIPNESSGFNGVRIASYTSSDPLNALADQLFDLAFTGDAEVYAPTLFGELDGKRSLDPKALVEELSMFDTVSVMDVITGEQRDTVIDMSFDKTELGSMQMRFELSEQGDLVIIPSYMAMGTQIFNPETGERRGVSNKFFLRNMDIASDEHPSVDDNLVFYTDSLGFFAPHSFAIHPEVSSASLMNWLRKKYPNHYQFTMVMDIRLNAADGELRVENVSLIPREVEAEA
ncbi:MAG: hypothetical protein HQ500_11500 [Flavobacteriales bacterium]|nr:hypothetical protein [Flavobacteriales bacterium]